MKKILVFSNREQIGDGIIKLPFVQDNHSRSKKGVLRGLHYQKNKPQGKLVRVVRGSVYDVAVDLRTESSTYGEWEGVELSEDNKCQLWIPPGFAHGFVVLSEIVDFEYKCTDYYDPNDEGTILWNDRDLNIDTISRRAFIFSESIRGLMIHSRIRRAPIGVQDSSIKFSKEFFRVPSLD